MVKVCVITGFGINADLELQQAFLLSGAEAQRVHITDLVRGNAHLRDFHILAFPGGFSFGDHLGSGKVFAALFKQHLRDHLTRFLDSGKLVIGICNGFQVLVKMGVLPDLSGSWKPEASLIHNDSGVFEDRWVRVRFDSASPCVWTKGLSEMDLPVRHGEGKFITADKNVLHTIESRNLAVLRYAARNGEGIPAYPDNPNGSVNHIAGICNESGRILGLMPHPEAFLTPQNHPAWARERLEEGEGLKIFRNAVEFAEKESGSVF